jgi:hypothetical protein
MHTNETGVTAATSRQMIITTGANGGADARILQYSIPNPSVGATNASTITSDEIGPMV